MFYTSFSKEKINGAHVINGIQIEWVKQYCNLKTVINGQWDNTQEIKCSIEKARRVFNKMSAIFKSTTYPWNEDEALEMPHSLLRNIVWFGSLDARRSYYYKTRRILNVDLWENAQNIVDA